MSPSPSAPAATTYFVLATLGLRLHQAPEAASPVVAVLRPAAQLDATERRSVGGNEWIHVHARSTPDLDGWVVNDPLLLTTIPMQQHFDPSAGYSLLFPSDWTYVAEGPEVGTFTSADKTQKLSVRTADSVERLPPVPTVAGKAEREEGPIDVYGKSPLIIFYRLQAGGYELAVNVLWAPGRAYQFLLRQPAADSSLMKQMLASLIFQ